jgi:hypothetical protein
VRCDINFEVQQGHDPAKPLYMFLYMLRFAKSV